MRQTENIKRLIQNAKINIDPAVRKAALDQLINELHNSKTAGPVETKPNIFTTIMKSRITGIAAAAVIIAVVLSITFLDKAVTPAYAIEQTIEAYQGTGYLRFHHYPTTAAKLEKEAWIRYDENGNVDRIRINLHRGENKHTAGIWSNGITQIWISHANTLEIDESGYCTPVMLGFAERYSPKHAVEHLYKNQQEGRCRIEIQEGTHQNDPIRITARYFPGKYLTYPRGQQEVNDVLLVDPQTKLVTQIGCYIVSEERMELFGVYKDYDTQPFDPNIFDVENEVPDDAIRVVYYNVDDINNVGIDEGSLSPEETDHLLIREFFNALIAKDYDRAGLLFGGMPSDQVRARFGDIKIVDLVSIGETVESADGLPSHYPCVVEIEDNGSITHWKPRLYTGRVIPWHNIRRRRVKAVF